jgi:hypothetical protein
MLVGHSLPWHLSKSIRVETLCLNLVSNQNMNNSKAKKGIAIIEGIRLAASMHCFSIVLHRTFVLHVAEMLAQLERNPHLKSTNRTSRLDEGVMRVAMRPVWVTNSLRGVDQTSQIPVLFWVSGVHFCKGIEICFPIPISVIPRVD